VLSEVEDARRKYRVRSAFQEHFGHVLKVSGSAAGDNRNPDRFAYAPGDDQIESRFGPVGIDAV
jgi:hypothetical protein